MTAVRRNYALGLALDEARVAVMIDDPERCSAAYDSLEARYGYAIASAAWSAACRMADAEAEA